MLLNACEPPVRPCTSPAQAAEARLASYRRLGSRVSRIVSEATLLVAPTP